MSKAIDDLPQSISEILRNLALEEECVELAQIADYVDDLEDQLHGHHEICLLAQEYATRYARMKAGLRIFAGEGKNKIRDLDHMKNFARYVIEHADDYSIE
jgi:hypothetical protein